MDAPPAEKDAGFTWGGGSQAAQAAQNQGGSDGLDRELLDAQAWDSLLGYCFEMRPFELGTPEYDTQRALATFNAAGPMLKHYKRLSPNAQSATCHVAQCIIPRQMKQHGDPNRRGADHGEALGASIKDGIHNRTLRRKKGTKPTVHEVKDEHGKVIKTWTQRALSVSRIMQAWRDMAVREKLLRDDASHDFLQRKHFKAATTGFATVGQAAGAGASKAAAGSIYNKLASSREHS